MRLMKGATLVRGKEVNDGERREEAIEYVMNKESSNKWRFWV